MRVDELVAMCFFAEVKVRRHRVLKKVDDQIAEQNQKCRRFATQFQAFRNHLDQSGGQHESRAQGDKVAEIAPLPVPLHNDRAAKDVGRGGG